MRKRVPDNALARSLLQASTNEMKFIETLTPSEEAASTIIRGIYENFRRLGEATLALQGYEGDHEEAINALIQLPVKTERPIQTLDNLRRLRHDINYRGYQPSLADLDDVISIKNCCWKKILHYIQELVNSKQF
jgi:predicted amino acid dehydrogenase